MLLEQGVSVGEIKLYGETESDDVLDETFNEDSFSELEAVMSKVGKNCEIMFFIVLLYLYGLVLFQSCYVSVQVFRSI